MLLPVYLARLLGSERGIGLYSPSVLLITGLDAHMDLELRNKVALVTGGSRGLGRAVCLGLAAEGVRVMVNFRRDEQLGTDAGRGTPHAVRGPRCVVAAGDVSSSADVTRMFDECEKQLGAVDILINNAGVWPTAFVKDLSEEDWDRTLAINLKGSFLTCREAVRRWLAATRGGRIVNVVSPAAFVGSTTGHADYAASKAGLVNLTVSLAAKSPRTASSSTLSPPA